MATPKVVAKKAVVKKAVVKPLDFIKEVVTKVINWENIPSGTKMTVKRANKVVQGILINQSKAVGRMYFCQDSFDGDCTYTRLGKKYSYSINTAVNTDALLKVHYNMYDVTFQAADKDFVLPKELPEMAGYRPVILKGKVKFGCKEVSNKNIRLIASQLID
jgi:hypothetical protein